MDSPVQDAGLDAAPGGRRSKIAWRAWLRPTAQVSWTLLSVSAVLGVNGGCGIAKPLRACSLTIFVDGAGNLSNGRDEIRRGLEAAGYRGQVEEFVWTTSFNPLIDQLNVSAARDRARQLSAAIAAFRRQHPDQAVNVVAHSAGTGVAIWAVELLSSEARIDNLILLASSLSHDYDIAPAARNVKGRIYVYYSPRDTILDLVRLVGTIDGRRYVNSAGTVGFAFSSTLGNKVINIGWSERWRRLAWPGGHSDCLSAQFARYELARHIIRSFRSDDRAPVGPDPDALAFASR